MTPATTERVKLILIIHTDLLITIENIWRDQVFHADSTNEIDRDPSLQQNPDTNFR